MFEIISKIKSVFTPKKEGHRLNDDQLTAGPLLGATARVSKAEVDYWKALMKDQGLSPTDRVLEMIRADLNMSGNPNIPQPQLQQQQNPQPQTPDPINEKLQLSALVEQLVDNMAKKDLQHAQDIDKITSAMIQQNMFRLNQSLPNNQNEYKTRKDSNPRLPKSN